MNLRQQKKWRREQLRRRKRVVDSIDRDDVEIKTLVDELREKEVFVAQTGFVIGRKELKT